MDQPDQTVWVSFGTHRYRRDADILYFEIHGTFGLEDTQVMYTLGEAVEREHGYVLTLFDARDIAGMTPAARKYVGERARIRMAAGASAIVGASFPIRALVTLVQNASALIGRPGPPTRFVATLEEAVQWLVTQRRICTAARAESRGK